MRLARPLSALGLGAVCAFGAPALSAQVTNTLDAGVSVVRYDGFLSSSAASVSPALHFDAPRVSAGARGTLLVFESGNRSLQGSLSLGAFSPSVGPFRFEVAGEGGASAYAEFARFAHLLGEVRSHWLSRRRGVWAGFTVGRAYYADTAYAARGLETGGWMLAGEAWLSASWRAMKVGDTVYTDATARARWARGRLEADANVGTRFASSGGGRGAFGEVSAVAWLSDGLALVASGGRYPSDPARGSIPGRYATVAMRLGQRAKARARVAEPPRLLAGRVRPPDNPTALAGVRFELGHAEDGAHAIRIHAASANRVEVMGDFSDWQPIPLVRADGVWEVTLRLKPGLYRFNVRVDGGTWGVPAGAEAAADDFDGVVATIVIP